MREANRINNNAKWLREQIHTLENGEIVYIWHEKSARIRDMDNEIELSDMKIDKAIGKHYTMYKRRS